MRTIPTPPVDQDGLDEFAELAGTSVKDSNSYDEGRSQSDSSGGALKCYTDENPSFFPLGPTVEKLVAGVYAIENHPNRGIHFQRKDIKIDELMILPDMNCARILEGIKSFWTRESAFRAHKLLWKRGLLLWGAPGSGKTSLLQLLSRDIVERDGLAIFAEDPHVTSKALEMLRKIEPTRPIVVILEDLDAMVKVYGESQLLALLDGEVQIDCVVYIGTTNYPELLDKRLINRPSRFDEIIKIDMPTEEARAFYLTHKSERLANNRRELLKWVEETKGMSVAHLRELIASVECLGHDFDSVMHRLKLMNRAKASSDQTTDNFGFTTGK